MMKEGKLLPDDIVNDIVQNRLAQVRAPSPPNFLIIQAMRNTRYRSIRFETQSCAALTSWSAPEQDDCMNNGWILDGYPRTVSQVRALEALGIIPDAVIVLDRPDEVVREWCRGRKTEPSTGIIYHPTYNPPPENVCTHLVARDDDHPEVIERRLEQASDVLPGDPLPLMRAVFLRAARLLTRVLVLRVGRAVPRQPRRASR